jgi:hypothetical protein
MKGPVVPMSFIAFTFAVSWSRLIAAGESVEDAT